MLLAAVFEEVAFRGYAFQRMVDAAGPIVAAAVFSGLFGALHLSNPSATPLSTANTALAGVLFSLAYLKTRGLWLPIGLHWAWNFTMDRSFLCLSAACASVHAAALATHRSQVADWRCLRSRRRRDYDRGLRGCHFLAGANPAICPFPGDGRSLK